MTQRILVRNLGLAAVVAVAAGLHLDAAAQNVERERPDRIERPFAKGGKIAMDLSAGGYTIRGGAADSIRVSWRTRDPREMASVKADLTVNGNTALLRTDGPSDNFRVDVDVPSLADLDIELSAGEVNLRGVEGNKSVSMWAGEVTMEVGDANLYKNVHVTVRAGEIDAGPFGGNRGGLFRSYHWSGSGKYSIVAKLTAGEVRLVK